MNQKLEAIDLCCGAGGWAVAARGLPIEFVAVADFAKDCLETWKYNHLAAHPRCEVLDVDLATKEGRSAVLAATGVHADLVLGGIPCEQVSTARANIPLPKGERDLWHALIDSCLSIVKELEPGWWALEDVTAIEKHLPPMTPHFRVDSSKYGPQKRIRTFVGHIPKLAPPKPGPRLLREIVRPGPWLLPPGTQDCERRGRQWYSRGVVRVFKDDKPCPTVTAFGATQNRGCMIGVKDGRMRQITLQEAATAQGFPEDFVFVAAPGRAWKMVGQAIPIYVGRAILEAVVATARKKGALR